MQPTQTNKEVQGEVTLPTGFRIIIYFQFAVGFFRLDYALFISQESTFLEVILSYKPSMKTVSLPIII